jgi:hypothetical protein
MSDRPAQLALLVLATVLAGEGLVCLATDPVGVSGLPRPGRDVRPGPAIQQSALPPPPCALGEERPGQARAELRQAGWKTWSACVGCVLSRHLPAWRTPSLLRPSLRRHTPLHVLLCTWLI